MAGTQAVRTSMGELLGAFAFASDLAFGLPLDDSLRSCYLATRIAEHLCASEDERMTVYYTALLKDAGCTSWTSELANNSFTQRGHSCVVTGEQDHSTPGCS
jgi:hypothetical protein